MQHSGRRANSLTPSLRFFKVAVASQEKKFCLVTDAPILSKPYIQIAYQGVQLVEAEFGWSDFVFEPQLDTELLPILQRATQSDCNLILAMGFLWNDYFPALARDHPGQKFIVIDFLYDPPLENLQGEV